MLDSVVGAHRRPVGGDGDLVQIGAAVAVDGLQQGQGVGPQRQAAVVTGSGPGHIYASPLHWAVSWRRRAMIRSVARARPRRRQPGLVS